MLTPDAKAISQVISDLDVPRGELEGFGPCLFMSPQDLSGVVQFVFADAIQKVVQVCKLNPDATADEIAGLIFKKEGFH